MRKIVVMVACLLMVSSVALASPLMDFSAGKGSVDLTMRNTANSMFVLEFDNKYNFDGTVTLGLGNNWAVQYRYFQPESAATDFGAPLGMTLKMRTNEYNVLYKLDKNIAAFAGYVTAQETDGYPGLATYTSETRKLWQVGFAGSAAIGKKTTLWGTVGLGRDLTNCELGVGYAITPNLDINVSYRSLNVNDLDGFEVKAKGLGFGVTLKF